MRCKSGDRCPVSGKWLLEESSEIMLVYKNDVFSQYQQKRAHYTLIEEIPGSNPTSN